MLDHSTNRTQETFDVCLLSMPFPPLNQPSMALGLLKAALLESGISVKTLYPCLWFAEEIGLDVYYFISESKQEFLAGEWTFAGVAFPDFNPDHEAYLDTVFSAPVSRGLLQRSRFGSDPRHALRQAREAAPGFVELVARRVLEHRPKIVGCTSTFMQHCASLAILRKIHELDPGVVTVLGGANCEGQMGLAAKKCFPWLDFVVSGEAELLFPEFCRQVLAGGKMLAAAELPEGVIGGAHPRLAAGAEAPRASVANMNLSPVPDFDDFFEALAASPLSEFISPGLAMETSRGCWWGKVHHCTFCGLNGGNMTFRSKSAERVLSELDGLSRRHGIRKFNIVDNILDLSYIQTLLPRLAMSDPYTLFFETKSNLKREQLEKIAAAGIRRLQPGIENMHDEILRLIDKGTTALLNVRLLKWARELGVFITWNFLWDVPGEKDEWYGEMAGWLRLVSHLQPPGVDRIQFHRFSPYHQRPESFGLSLVPFPLYSYVYPVAPEEMRELAYYFNDAGRESAKVELERRVHLKQVMRIIAVWNSLWGQDGMEVEVEPPTLVMREDAEGLHITDTRPCAFSGTHFLQGLHQHICKACDEIHTVNSLLNALSKNQHRDFTEETVQRALDELVERKLLLHLDGRYLGLALREVRRIPDSLEEFPGGYTDIRAWQARSVPSQGFV
ncbi:MAG: RiPP maturation radical SAM C-methyltransferase [Pyrinomonadaceae bacterium]